MTRVNGSLIKQTKKERGKKYNNGKYETRLGNHLICSHCVVDVYTVAHVFTGNLLVISHCVNSFLCTQKPQQGFITFFSCLAAQLASTS